MLTSRKCFFRLEDKYVWIAMAQCSYCGESEQMPFRCKFCKGVFCSSHRLPENHECVGLERFKKERLKDPEKWVYEPFQERHVEKTVRRGPKKPLLYGNLNQRQILYLVLVLILLLTIYRSLF